MILEMKVILVMTVMVIMIVNRVKIIRIIINTPNVKPINFPIHLNGVEAPF